MAAITDVTVGTGWGAVDTGPVGSVPPTLWNPTVNAEAILIRFGGTGDSHSIAVDRGVELMQAGQLVEAQCVSGGKTLQVLRTMKVA